MVNVRRIVLLGVYDWTSVDVITVDASGEMMYKPESFEIPVDVLNTVGWTNKFAYPGNKIIPMTVQDIAERNAFRAEKDRKMKIEERKIELRAQLKDYSEDFIQVQLGAIIPQWEERKIRFNELHAELRQLEGKAPRNKRA